MEARLIELVENIKSGTHWYTGQMSKEEQEELSYIYNFKQLNFMTVIQVKNMMDDLGIVAFAGDLSSADHSVKVRGYPVFHQYIPLSQSAVDFIEKELNG